METNENNTHYCVGVTLRDDEYSTIYTDQVADWDEAILALRRIEHSMRDNPVIRIDRTSKTVPGRINPILIPTSVIAWAEIVEIVER